MTVPPGGTTLERLQYAYGGGAVLSGHLEKLAAILDYIQAEPGIGVNTAITTIGAGTLTAAALAGSVITRSGSIAAYTDTTATAAQLWAAVDNPQAGQSWIVTINNTVAFAQTLAAGVGVTLSGPTVIPALGSARFLVTLASAAAATVQGLGVSRLATMPAAQLTTVSAGDATLAAGVLTGADFVVIECTANSANAVTVRTAVLMIADIPNVQVGMSWRLRIVSAGNNTVTLTTALGVTLTGTMTIATATFRDFLCTVTAATTITIKAIGQGTFT